MKEYIVPQLSVIELKAEDMIVTSGDPLAAVNGNRQSYETYVIGGSGNTGTGT